MSPLLISINGMSTQLGASLPNEIFSLDIQLLMPMQIQPTQSPLIKQWLNQIIDKLNCEYVSYNKILIPINELKKF